VEDDARSRTQTATRPSDEPSTSSSAQRVTDFTSLRGPILLSDEDDGKTWRDRVVELIETTDGSSHDDGIGVFDRIDRVAAFAPAILAIRWGTTIASIALATQQLDEPRWLIGAWCIVLVLYTVLRTARPIRYRGDLKSLLSVIAEVVILVAALCTTGYWESPFILSMLTAITVAGFARGFGFALRIGIASSMAVTIPFLVVENTDARIILSLQWTLVMLLVGVIAGYARRISGEADRQHSLALDRLGRLADANALLFSLHRVTQTLPASLDLDEVLDTTVGRLRGLFDFDFAVVLAVDDTDGNWQVLRREGGGRLASKLTASELPEPVRRAIEEGTVVNVPSFPVAGTAGLTDKANCGMYAVLPARGSIIGLIAIEDTDERHFNDRDAELLKGFVESVALAIDNARWFARLRTVGADEERTRIARDLHDRIGQSLAYLAFELDRIVAIQARGEHVTGSLEQLREDVRGVIREVRDTLYDLRTDVSEQQDMAATLEAYVGRVRERSGMAVEIYCDRNSRLPILQEREMWRIAQEALTNVERHSAATQVRVLWRCNGESAALEVTDNGHGFPIGRAGRLDSYGLLGMRERASSIGATLDITSHIDKGTRVRCSLIRSSSRAHSAVAS
jgi:signal transduction histidine kinase